MNDNQSNKFLIYTLIAMTLLLAILDLFGIYNNGSYPQFIFWDHNVARDIVYILGVLPVITLIILNYRKKLRIDTRLKKSLAYIKKQKRL